MRMNLLLSSRTGALLLSASVVVLGGCSTFEPDGGFAPVQRETQLRTGLKAQWLRSDAEQTSARQEVSALLSKTLSVDDAVQVALLNNRGLQAAYAELGVSEADLVQASRLPNPSISFGRLRRGDEVEFDHGLQFNLARMLTAPLVSGIEARRFEQTRRIATLETLSLVFETRKAWFNAVAAKEAVRYAQQVLQSAEIGEELASRMAAAGNWSKLDHAREQGFYADAALGLARTTQAELNAREKLTRLMGVWGEQLSFNLPDRLPELPKMPTDQPDVEQVGMAQRLDVQAMKAQSEGLARNLGLSKVTRFLNVLELGAVSNTYNAELTQRGYVVSLEVPLFDWGSARTAKAEAMYMQSVDRLSQTAVNARSEIRQSYAAYRSSYDIARHYKDEVVPNRKRVSEENQLRYNGMFIGVFDLLADARSQVMAVNGYIDALRDFWLAQSDMQLALVGPPPLSSSAASVSSTAASN